MTVMASVKVAREKLLELLHEAKDEKLKKFDEAVERHNEKVVRLRQDVVQAASADLSEAVKKLKVKQPKPVFSPT